jgi:hypothetical protein
MHTPQPRACGTGANDNDVEVDICVEFRTIQDAASSAFVESTASPVEMTTGSADP